MLGFDVILGMDWLLKHYSSINCKRKEVTFISPGDKEFKFGGAKRELPHRLSQQFKRRGVLRMVAMPSKLVLSRSLI